MDIQNLVLLQARAGEFTSWKTKLMCMAIVLAQLAAEIVVISALVHIGWKLG